MRVVKAKLTYRHATPPLLSITLNNSMKIEQLQEILGKSGSNTHTVSDADRMNCIVKSVLARDPNQMSDKKKLSDGLRDYRHMTFAQMVNHYL